MPVTYAPIAKIISVFVASGVTFVALRLGIDLGSDAINEAAIAIVGILAGYLTPDPRVS